MAGRSDARTTDACGLTRARWTGRSDRARLLQGLDTEPRVVGARGVTGHVVARMRASDPLPRLMWLSPSRKNFRRGCSATAATAWCSMSAGWAACSASRRRLAPSSHRGSLAIWFTGRGSRGTRIAVTGRGFADRGFSRDADRARRGGPDAGRCVAAVIGVPGLTVVTDDVASALAPVRLDVLRHVCAEMHGAAMSGADREIRVREPSAIREIRVP